MSPEYLEELAQRADPDQLWRRGFDRPSLSDEQRKQLDTAVALRRYARHLRDVRQAGEEGKSWLTTQMRNGHAVRSVAMPRDHQRLIEGVKAVDPKEQA